MAQLSPSRFVKLVVEAGADEVWSSCSAGRGGVAFFLAADKLRHARLMFQRDREMGADGMAAPTILLGTDEIGLDELPLDDLVSWTIHLRGRRNHNEADIEFVKALFSVLKL